MKWILDDIKRGIAQLRRWQTWLVIGVLGVFGLLSYLVSELAFKTDSILLLMHYRSGNCGTLTNPDIMSLFFGIMFFLIGAILTLGELQRFFDLQKHAAHYEARRALLQGIFWCALTLVIAAGGLLFFSSRCG